jgi:hypothetical protein
MADKSEYITRLGDAGQRETMAKTAGDTYVDDIAGIRAELDGNDDGDFGASLGKMLEVQVKMTEAETEFMTTSSIPKKVSSTILQAGQEVKKTAGG